MTFEHYKFWNENSDVTILDAEQAEFSDLWERKNYLINFRATVYKKNYLQAEKQIHVIQNIISDFPELMTEQLMSDIGKTFLYGNSNSLEAANYFKTEAAKYKGTPIEFYCWFYAGRLYDKAGANIDAMSKSFLSAVNCTKDSQQSDNALWYLFRTNQKSSVLGAVDKVEKYALRISDPYYYDDFFDMLSPLLLSEKRFGEFGKLYKSMKGHASDESTAKYAYIYARLLEEEIYTPEEFSEELIKSEINDAYKTALNSATDMYYKIMAAQKLHFSNSEKKSVFLAPRNLNRQTENQFSIQTKKEKKKKNNSKSKNNKDEKKLEDEIELLLNGYAFFGFPEKIYSEWVKLGSPVLSEETAIGLSKFLKSCSNGEDNYLVQSLRIAAKTANYSKSQLSKELLEYVYPKNYEEFVKKYCDKYGLQKSVLWALIRSESFFDPDVKSSAGAIGLCQLMPSTGEDIARRLKKTNYDLTDPETSIEFGAYYLDNLIGRLDGSYLDAFFSYNAGITRLRKWKKSSALEFGVNAIPEDLFLETLPYTETREYGRKVVAATEMYEWVWDKK